MEKNLANYNSLITNVPHYWNSTKNISQTFGGPSIYFHEKALEWQRKDFLGERHVEYIYATLVAWGMHRMGDSGAKMPDFCEFSRSISAIQTKLNAWKELRIETISKEDFENLLPELTEVCFSITASTSDSKVVSSSKTLSHILPNLVCPMDRNYTLDFFNMSLGSEEKERKFFQFVMRQMWIFYQDKEYWGTIVLGGTFSGSYPKIFDNLIIAYMKENPKA